MASEPGDKKQRMEIDVVSDFACPWCYLGKKNLEAALSELDSRLSFSVRWKPFLLRPDTPAEGGPAMPLTHSFQVKLQHLRSAYTEAGLELKMRDTVRMPYTVRAHMLMEWVEAQVGVDKQNEVAEKLFKGYFLDGQDYDLPFLLDVAKEAGLDVSHLQSYLENPVVAIEVKNKALSWSRQGVTGVPYFFFNGKPAFSGAQETLVFKQVLLKVAEKFPLDSGRGHNSNL